MSVSFQIVHKAITLKGNVKKGCMYNVHWCWNTKSLNRLSQFNFSCSIGAEKPSSLKINLETDVNHWFFAKFVQFKDFPFSTLKYLALF